MKMLSCLNSLEGRKASFLISMGYLHFLSLLPPAEWVTHLQLSSYQLNDTISPISVALLVAEAQGCTIPIPADTFLPSAINLTFLLPSIVLFKANKALIVPIIE
jgi:hypothetical protein